MARKDSPRSAPRTARIADVASRAGVSIATVSRILNDGPNRASAATVARVRHAASDLGYRPSQAGRALRTRQSRMVAVLASNLANPTMAALASALERALRREGLGIVLADSHDQPDLQDEHLRELQSHQPIAIALLGAVRSPFLTELRGTAMPLLFVNRPCPDAPDAAYVGVDNVAAGAEVAMRLIDAGAVPMGLIQGTRTSSATVARVDGFLATAAARGRPVAGDACITSEAADHLEVGYAGMATLLKSQPATNAVFCTSDLVAFGAHRLLEESNMAGRVALVGFDDNPLNPWVAPWLSSVSVPYAAVGAAVAALSSDIARGRPPESCMLPHTFVGRGRFRCR